MFFFNLFQPSLPGHDFSISRKHKTAPPNGTQPTEKRFRYPLHNAASVKEKTPDKNDESVLNLSTTSRPLLVSRVRYVLEGSCPDEKEEYILEENGDGGDTCVRVLVGKTVVCECKIVPSHIEAVKHVSLNTEVLQV